MKFNYKQYCSSVITHYTEMQQVNNNGNCMVEDRLYGNYLLAQVVCNPKTPFF